MKNCWSTDFCPAFSEVSIPLNKRLAVAGEREVKDQPWQSSTSQWLIRKDVDGVTHCSTGADPAVL